MSTRKRTAPTSTAAGFLRTPKYHEFELDRGDGQEPLKAKVQVNIPYGELSAIPSGRPGADVTVEEVFAAIAPYVSEWNLLAIDESTGQPAPVPAPMAAGAEVLGLLDWPELIWIVDKVRHGWGLVALLERQVTPEAQAPSEVQEAA